ncbi:DNA mismatch repair protein MutS [Thermoflavimicrobium dichotomicum]|uniref:DNA mismatch repair protein MutS n=1 Tax=Thermoflavimicrobium dichotomicum TaxID=46223 RepID=A0A1I3RWU9_9BACL|nr:DNA mismatch repair protein MutS [Thermoflavimicrobium dichotomicum]SFJ50372.1 DNA mismatch repair protein MutS [Thermoflavimicrobium dichotomicum]
MAKYTPMIQQYLSIKAQYPDAFLFFRLGDFYEMFFDDAKKAAEELEITLTGRDGGGNERIPMCGVPYHSAHSYIEKLISKGYKVAICEQVEDPASAKGVVKREVVRVITPGTIIEENMLVEQENNFLVALAGTDPSYALVAVDLSTGECHMTEISASMNFLLDEISAYRPKEVVLDEELLKHDKLVSQIKARIKAVITPYTNPHVDEEMLRLQFPQYSEVCTTHVRKQGLALLYAYLQQTQKRSLGHLNRLRYYDAKQYMMLDDAARRNLELTSTLGEGKKRGSLLWLLDRTATAMGSRLLKKWLDKPLLSIGEIEKRQDIVEAFLGDLLFLEEIRELLKQVYDLERLAARIAFGSANARDLNAIRRSLEVIPQLKERLQASGCAYLQQIGQSMDSCQDLCELIARAIVDEPPLAVKEGGIIREGYHPELDQLRDIQKNGKSWIAQLEQKEREATGIKSLKIGYNRVFGYYIEVTKSNLRYIPEGRYIRKQTLANAERFITPELKEKEQLILNASEKSVEMEYELFVQVRNHVSGEVQRLQALAEWVATLDVLHAFAKVAEAYRYVRPTLHTGDQLVIEAGRHPVVEAVTEEGTFVANDVELNVQDRQVLLITGPNMAGKSTYMRQVALITILAQMGSFVPADRADISIVDRIFTRIGAADDLVGGRSTFMVEMAETCHALKEATPRSLILLDEVGRGTSTYDGMALAHAIVEYIHDHVGAKTLFSTHYHELTRLEDELERVVNVHAECIEKDGKVVFLHRIVPGGADRSYGIHVAELAGLPEPVIERAKVILNELENGQTEVAATVVSNPEPKEEATLEEMQLTLFDYLPKEEAMTVKEPPVSSKEREVLEALRNWDLMNQTPFETMQFVLELQKKLK